jgi:hypothetical protein
MTFDLLQLRNKGFSLKRKCAVKNIILKKGVHPPSFEIRVFDREVGNKTRQGL